MDDYLFSEKDLNELIRSFPDAMRKIVESWEKNKVLAASEMDLIEFLVRQATPEVPTLLLREYWKVAIEEAKIDVRHEFLYEAFGHPAIVEGQRITVEIPFDGDAKMFDFKPSTFTFNSPSRPSLLY